MKVGIITDHFPMHNRNTVKDIEKSMLKYKRKLLMNFIGNRKYMKYF